MSKKENKFGSIIIETSASVHLNKEQVELLNKYKKQIEKILFEPILKKDLSEDDYRNFWIMKKRGIFSVNFEEEEYFELTPFGYNVLNELFDEEFFVITG